MEPIRVGEKMVMVELMCDRPFKDDCRGLTPVMWHGKGDVQPYPARLWPKLAEHPDVWSLHVQKTQAQIDAAAEIEAAAQRMREANARADAAADAAAGGQGETGLVATAAHTVTAGNKLLSEDEVKAMPIEELRALAIARDYQLHPRLGMERLVIEFLAKQAG